ncbi:MAG TPA: winged helix DNA-binding domain-containing protein [Nitrososphaerales archaeon]|nr:winged helix DNA-binding domain-containing protein [Nitrososphaerales archaeon]
MLRLSRDQVNSWRLNRQHLTARKSRRAIAEVVSDVCGVQAQVPNAAELAIRARVEGATQIGIREALWKEHSIVRTWCMRGTLHLLASSDLPVYVAAMKTELSASQEWLQKTQGLPLSEVAAITAEIKSVLGDRVVARDDLVRQVESRLKLSRASREALKSPWGILLRPAAYQGALAFGPPAGSKSTLFRPDRWILDWKEPTTRKALSELFLRFVRCYGPARAGEFARWWGSRRGEEKSVPGTIGDELEEVRFGEGRGWMLRADAEEASGLGPARVVRLLPSFDCYAMFYSPREAFVPQAQRSRIFRQTAGWNYPAIVVDGVAAGTWGLRRRSRRVDVILEPFRGFTPTEKTLLQEEAADIGSFYGLPAELMYAQA